MLDLRYILLISAFSTLPARAIENWDVVEKQRKEKIRIASRYPYEAFEKAVRVGDIEKVKRLLDQGVPANLEIPASDTNEEPPGCIPIIHHAIWEKRLDIVRLLLDHGADPNIRNDEDGNTPLMQSDNIEIAKLLLSRGANIHARDNSGGQVMHNSFGFIHENLSPKKNAEHLLSWIKFLIENGADPLAKSNDQTQPIHFAAIYGTAEIVKFFMDLETKANTESQKSGQRDKYLKDIMLYVVQNLDEEESLKIAKLLIIKEADVNIKNAFSVTPLHRSKDAAMTKLLLDHGAKKSINAITSDSVIPSGTPLHLSKNSAVTKVLLDHGARMDIMSPCTSKNMPIHYFAISGDTESIRLLLDHGADPNVLTGFSLSPQSPLDIAVHFNHPDTVELLLERGAKPTRRTSEYRKRSGNPEMLRIIRKGTNSLGKGPPHRR